MENEFLPVLLGSDRNVYGMARAFYEQYGIKSIALGKSNARETLGSQLIVPIKEPGLEDDSIFVERLLALKKDYPNIKLVLIACSDVYMKLVINNKEALKDSYIIPYVDKPLMDQLVLKEQFYKTCDTYHLKYPKTEICTKEEYQNYMPSFPFPIIIKPSNSVAYWKCDFEGKNKVFICRSKEKMKDIFNKVYQAGYGDSLIIQEYIPGDDTHLRVLNAYVDSSHKVTFMGLGQILLEEKAPKEIGDYGAIITTYDQKLMDQMKAFLEDIQFFGYANFDFKYDDRTNEYIIFEINIRQGRSSSFTTVSGYNITKYLIDDVIYHKHREPEYLKNEYLWNVVGKHVILKHLKNKELLAKVKQLYRQRKASNLLFYKNDMGFARWKNAMILQIRTIQRYDKYYK